MHRIAIPFLLFFCCSNEVNLPKRPLNANYWPLETKALATTTDRPTCDTASVGRLIYLIAEKRFEVCEDSGWTTIDIAGAQGPTGESGAAGTSVWTESASNISFSSGNVGIGEANPSTLLTLKSPSTGTVPTLSFYDSTSALVGTIGPSQDPVLTGNGLTFQTDAASGTGSAANHFLTFRFAGSSNKLYFGDTGTSTLIQAGHDLQIRANEGSGADATATPQIVLQNGNVGIGAATPARKLHISDAMRLEPIASPPASPANGDLYYDTSHALCAYVNGAWEILAGAGSCA
jgi:hypothetical protein